jgi:hypothetical protein
VGCILIIQKDINIGEALHFFPQACQGVVRNDYSEDSVFCPASLLASGFALRATPRQDAVAVFVLNCVSNLPQACQGVVRNDYSEDSVFCPASL